MHIFDCHTHNRQQPFAIINAEASKIAFNERLLYSAGIHPWWIENASESLISSTLQLAASTANVVAIGECGIDHAISTPLVIQQKIFYQHIALSESAKKPLIIHCVRAWQELLAMHSAAKPHQPWIIHGFRAKPSVAEKLLQQGLYLSFGHRFNTESLLITPAERMFVETDDSGLDIAAVAQIVAQAASLTLEQLASQVNSNAAKLFGL